MPNSSIHQVVTITQPETDWLPIVLDSPHSGTCFPDDFDAIAPAELIRAGEDTLVHELFPGPANGAVMVACEFPRTYIDPNRPLTDLDIHILDGEWPEPVKPSNKSAVGTGLIWTRCINGETMYDRRLQVAEVRNRIDRYWRPYRNTLQASLDHAYARAGKVWHINCHSMPSIWPPGVEGAGLPVEADFLLGSRDGTTCDDAMTELVASSLRASGYRVAINDRFKGVDIVQCSGAPKNGRHSLQIEVVRDRYIDESMFTPNDQFPQIQAALGNMLRALAEHARASASW